MSYFGRSADKKAFKIFRSMLGNVGTYESFEQRRQANAKKIEGMTDEELAKVPPRDVPAGVPGLAKRYIDALIANHPISKEKETQKNTVRTILAASQDPDVGRLPSRSETAIDSLQLAGDAAGVVDQSGAVDGVNAMVSLARAAVDKDRRGEHLTNAVISGIGMIPLVGDIPKLLKAKRAGQTLSDARRLAGGGKKAAAAVGTEEPVTAELVGSAAGGAGRSDASDVVGGMIDSYMAKHRVRWRGTPKDESRSSDAEAGGDGHDGAGSPGGPGTGRPPDPAGDGGDDEKDRREDTEGKRKFRDATKAATRKLEDLTFGAAKFVVATVAMIESIRLANKGALAMSKHLQQVNGQIAMAEARREIAGIQRDIREGRVIGGAYERAAEAGSRFDDAQSRFVAPVKSISTDVTGTLADVSAKMIELADNTTEASNLLSVFASATGNAAKGASQWTEAGKNVAEVLANIALPPEIKGAKQVVRAAANRAGQIGGDDSPATPKLFDDIADGKLDGKSRAGTFFFKDKRK